jgi:hypothetical protein
MTDYLHNLVSRTLGLAPVVQPRLASLFEPAASVAAEFPTREETVPESIQVGERRSRPVSDHAPRVPLANSRVSRTEATPLATVNARGPAETAKSEARELSQRSLARSAEPPTIARNSPTSVVARATTLEANPLPDMALRIAEPAVGLTNSETPIRALAREPQVPAALTRSKQEGTRVAGLLDTEPLMPAHSDVLETMAARARATQVLGVLGQSKNPSSFPKKDASTLFPAAEVEPTISITIGRVDVRAVFPQTQAQPTRRVHPPPMSLDEYLKRRNEGRK